MATVCVILFDSGGRLMLDGTAGLALPLYLTGGTTSSSFRFIINVGNGCLGPVPYRMSE
jgi:hypothetical protein